MMMVRVVADASVSKAIFTSTFTSILVALSKKIGVESAFYRE
jgi:hypothetical protein